jgi:hypothetical protein
MGDMRNARIISKSNFFNIISVVSFFVQVAPYEIAI